MDVNDVSVHMAKLFASCFFHDKSCFLRNQVRLGDLNVVVPCAFSMARQQHSSHLERPSMLILSVKSCSLASPPSRRSGTDNGETMQTANHVLRPFLPSIQGRFWSFDELAFCCTRLL